MTTDFDWRIEGEPAALPAVRRPLRRSRRLWLLLALVTLALSTLGWMLSTANRRQAEMAVQVRHVAQMEEAARRTGDSSAFLALQDRTDDAWLALQRFRLKQKGFHTLPALGLTETGDAPEYGEVGWEDGYARLEVTRTFVVTDSGGLVREVSVGVPQFYRPWGRGWVRAWPSPDWWGPEQTYSGRRLYVTYPARAGADVLPLARQLDEWATQACDDWGCPEEARFTVHFSSAPGALQWLNRADFDFGAMTLPIPALSARPAGPGSDDPVMLGTGRLLVRALALELSGSYHLALISALAAAEEARLGLGPPFQLDDAGPIVAGWRRGNINFLSSFRAMAAEATLMFLRETYPQAGERALLAALHPPDPTIQKLAQALGLTPEALIEAWLAYGQAHWSNTAGRPLPQGQLALACDAAIRLRDLAYGTSRDLMALPSSIRPVPLSGVYPLAWSPDGVWLGVTAGDPLAWYGRSRFAVAWLKNLVSGEERALGQGWFVGWAPDGQHYAVYRPDVLQTHVYSLSGGAGRSLPGQPALVVWSPDSAYLAYVAPGEERAGMTIWLSAGDALSARPLVRGYAPIWSPDSQSLVYLPPGSSVGAPALTLISVSTGVTRTLLTPADLTAELAAGGSVAQGARVTALYPAAWSPDGTTIAVWVRLEGAEGAGAGLATVRVDGSARRLWLVTDWLSKVRWSPDGRYLSALTGGIGEPPRSVTPRRVWVMALETGAQAMVDGADFFWSPDGRWLAVEQAAGPAVFSADLEAVWRLPPGCRIGGWRLGQ